MRKPLQLAAVILCSLIAFSSCTASRESVAQRKVEIEQSKEPTTACFVQLTDGTIRNYATLQLKTGLLKTPYLLADGKTKIYAKDIKAYQNKNHYAISQATFVSGHRSYVAKETLPGFAVRIAKGRINVYAKKYYNGVTAVDEFFVQKGDEGQVLAYTTENMNEMVRDDDEALAFFVMKKYNTTKSYNPSRSKTDIPESSASDTDSYAKTKKIKTTKNK